MKKVNFSVGAVGWCLLILTFGCTNKIFYEPNAPAFLQIQSKELVTKHDAYIIQFPVEERYALPQIASGARVPGLYFSPLPEEGNPTLIGRTLEEGIKVLDIVPKGTRFKVVALRREERPVVGRRKAFEIEFIGPLHKAWPRIDARWITNDKSGEPYIYWEFAEGAYQ